MEKKPPKKHHPVIVDRCWSLLPLSLISALVVCIFFKSAALFYVAFMEEFGISHQSASWPLNLTGMMQHLAGLLVWFLQDKLSLYHITLLGCVLNSASLIASAVVPDIVWMSITAGIINGLGVGMGVLSLSLYAVTYFDKYRATASGFKYAGTVLVPLVFPLAISAALREYGLRGTLLLLAAVILNLIPIAMLMKTPKPVSLSCKRKETKSPKKSDGLNYGTERDLARENTSPQAPCFLPSRDNSDAVDLVDSARPMKSADKKCTVSGKQTENTAPSGKRLSSRGSRADVQEEIIREEPASIRSAVNEQGYPRYTEHTAKDTGNIEMSSFDPAGQNESGRSISSEGYPDVSIQKREQSSANNRPLCSVDSSILNLFKSNSFYILVITFTVAEYALQTFETTVFDYAMDKGIERSHAEPFITYVAVAQMIGQLTVPFLWDRSGFRRSILGVLCLLAEAVCFMAMPHANKFWHTFATTMGISFPMGCLLLLKPVMLADHVGVQRLAACWGIAGIAMLPFAFGMPLLIGVFRDTMGSYDNLYRLLSAFCAILAVVMLCFSSYEIRARKQQSESSRPFSVKL